jgi:sirohydrochlorin ferrochelatase
VIKTNRVQEGVLIIAQGCSEKSGNEAIRQAVNQARLPYPKVLGFLENEMPDIDTAVKDLEQQGVNRMIVVSLFISSQSGKADVIMQVEPESGVTFTNILDDHPLVAEILAENLMTVSAKPSEEIAILVCADGSAVDKDLASLTSQVKARLDLKDVYYISMGKNIPAVREVVSQAQTEGQVIVTPVLLSKVDAAEKTVRQALEGLNYRYTGKALIPHPNISRFIEWRVAETVLPSIQFKKGHETISLGLNDAQRIAQASGAGYPCSVLAFRVARITFRSIWEIMPAVDDLKVVSYLPPEAGSRPVFEFIAGEANVNYRGDWSEITPESSTFIFTDRATGATLRIQARESTFGGRDFFDLRNRVINKKGTPEEGRLLSKYLQDVLSNLLSKSDEELFTWTSSS